MATREKWYRGRHVLNWRVFVTMVTLEIRFRMSAKIHGMIKREIFFYVFINVFMFPYELRRRMSVMLQIESMICQAEVQIYFYFPLKNNAFWRIMSYNNIFDITFFCTNYIILNDIFTLVIFKIQPLPFNGGIIIDRVCLDYLAGLIIFVYYFFLEKFYFK